MKEEMVERDERTVAVANAGYRWACNVMIIGLLAAAGYRGLVWKESSWDLMALVVAGGLTAMVYQGAHKALARRWWLTAIIIMVAAAVIGAGIAYLSLRWAPIGPPNAA